MISGHRARLRAVALLTACWLAILVLGPVSSAEAHNELLKATPADGSTLAHLPESGRLEFAETVQPADLTVVVGGKDLWVSAVPGDAHALDFDLANVTPAKTLVITWTVVDEHDGHRSGGTLRLHLTGAKTSDRAETTVPAHREPLLLEPVERVSKVVGYLAMAVVCGGLFFLALIWPAGAATRRARTLLVTSVIAGLAASAGSVAVVLWRGSQQSVAVTLATDYGRAATSEVLIWLLAAVLVGAVLQLDEVAVRGLAWRVGAVAIAGGLVRVAGINAHATQGKQPMLGIAADFLHLTAVSAWVGGLVMLSVCLLPRRRIDELEEVVPKFSVLALSSVLAIVASGLLLLWEVSRGIDGFWSTHYARVLVVKLSLFAVVMLAAMKSKRWVDSALADAVVTHRRTALRSLTVSVATETVLVIAVLAAASVLVTSSPGQ